MVNKLFGVCYLQLLPDCVVFDTIGRVGDVLQCVRLESFQAFFFGDGELGPKCWSNKREYSMYEKKICGDLVSHGQSTALGKKWK